MGTHKCSNMMRLSYFSYKVTAIDTASPSAVVGYWFDAACHSFVKEIHSRLQFWNAKEVFLWRASFKYFTYIEARGR